MEHRRRAHTYYSCRQISTEHMSILVVNVLIVKSWLVRLLPPLPIDVVSKSVLYTWYSVKKCLAYPLSVFFQVERRRDDARRERRSSALKGPGAHRQRSEAAGRALPEIGIGRQDEARGEVARLAPDRWDRSRTVWSVCVAI